jgi:nucleoside-diphosphate-sugar epimerase
MKKALVLGAGGFIGHHLVNSLKKIGWAPNYDLSRGIEKTYRWVLNQVEKAKEVKK